MQEFKNETIVCQSAESQDVYVGLFEKKRKLYVIQVQKNSFILKYEAIVEI